MPATVSHAYSATTPENAANGEVGPNAWNSTHAMTLSAAGSEIFGAFSNDPAFNVTFTTNGGGRVVANAPAVLSVTGANGSSVAPQTLAFSNSNGMTLGVSTAAGGATVTGSYTVPAIPGATVFSNSNNVSFGLAGSTVTATATFSQSNQAASAANGSFAFQTLSFSNVNGVSFGTSAGSAITASISQSNQAIGVYGISNTTQNSSGTVDARSLSIAAYGIISVGTTNGSIVISSPDSTGYTALSVGNSNLGNTAGDTGVFTGRVVFVGSNNITLSGSSNGISQTISIIGGAGGGAALTVSDNATSLTVSRLAFTQSNGITMSLSTAAGAATVIGSYTVPTVTNSSMTVSDAATSGTLARIAFTNLNGVTLSLSTGAGGSHTIVGSHNALTSQSNQNVTANNGGFAFQTLSFSNVNGVSFGTSAGSAITASHNALTSQSSWTVSDNATSATVGRLAFTQSNGLTLSLSTSNNGNHTVIGSYTVPTVTNSSMSVSDAATSGTLARLAFTNLNGVTLSLSTGAGGSHTIVGSHNALISQSNQAFSASGGSSAFQTLNFANSNGVTFSNSAGSVIASYTVPTVTSWTVSDAATSATVGRLAFTNSNGLTLSLSTSNNGNHTVIGSYTVPSVTDYFSKTNTTFNGANISGSITHNTAGLQLSLSVAAPGAAAENNAINLLGANTAGNTTATGSTIGWSGVNITLSGTNNSQVVVSAPATSSLIGSSNISVSTNGSTITVGQVLQSYYENVPVLQGSTTVTGFQSTSVVVPLYIDNPISFGFIRIPMSASCAASSTAATTGNTQFSYGQTRSHNFVIYSRGVGANSMSLQSVASTQLTDQQSFNVSANANSTQFSYTNRATYQSEGGSVGFTYDYSSSAASLNFHTSGMTAITGQKMMAFPWATSLSAGQYWLVYGVSSSTQSQFTNVGTKWFNIFSNYGASQANIAFGPIGANTNSSVGLNYGMGSFTTAGGGTTNSIPISAVSTFAAHMRMAVQLANIA